MNNYIKIETPIGSILCTKPNPLCCLIYLPNWGIKIVVSSQLLVKFCSSIKFHFNSVFLCLRLSRHTGWHVPLKWLSPVIKFTVNKRTNFCHLREGSFVYHLNIVTSVKISYIISVCAVVYMRFSSYGNIKCAWDTPPLILIIFL
jgi:hypothetical protein